ncbi:hypothetical protein JYK21_01285 [Ralstonia pickettii]|nr:hypothetical protein [Ralstonia pickettii]
MSDSNQIEKRKSPKGLIAIIVAIVVLIGGAAVAMSMISSSLKVTYFKAEKDSYDFIVEQLEEKYAPELEWYNKTKEAATESKIDISANYNTPAQEAMLMDPAQIINNSTLTVLTQTDMENKEISAGISANVAGLSVDGFNLFVTADDLLIQTPFINELLQIKDEDIGPLLNELDPAGFDGEASIDFAKIFERQGEFLTEEEKDYLKKEYLDLLYDELSEDSFSSTDETIEVNGQSVKTEKIEMALTEDEVKELLSLTFDKMKEDERIKEMIKDQLTYGQLGGSLVETEIEEALGEFENSLEQAKQEIANLHISNGLNSTVWINDGLIVQRDFSFEIGPSEEELVKLSVTGSQLLTAASQWFDYDFAFADLYDEGSLQLAGELTWEDNKANDIVTLTAADTVLTYEGTETLEDGSRNFERKLLFNDSVENAEVQWNGVSSYDKDQMDSEHTFKLGTVNLPIDTVGLQLNIEGKVIDSVEMPENENFRDLGMMSIEELNNYFETEFYPSFEEWMYGLLMGGAAGF